MWATGQRQPGVRCGQGSEATNSLRWSGLALRNASALTQGGSSGQTVTGRGAS